MTNSPEQLFKAARTSTAQLWRIFVESLRIMWPRGLVLACVLGTISYSNILLEKLISWLNPLTALPEYVSIINHRLGMFQLDGFYLVFFTIFYKVLPRSSFFPHPLVKLDLLFLVLAITFLVIFVKTRNRENRNEFFFRRLILLIGGVSWLVFGVYAGYYDMMKNISINMKKVYDPSFPDFLIFIPVQLFSIPLMKYLSIYIASILCSRNAINSRDILVDLKFSFSPLFKYCLLIFALSFIPDIIYPSLGRFVENPYISKSGISLWFGFAVSLLFFFVTYNIVIHRMSFKNALKAWLGFLRGHFFLFIAACLFINLTRIFPTLVNALIWHESLDISRYIRHFVDIAAFYIHLVFSVVFIFKFFLEFAPSHAKETKSVESIPAQEASAV